MLRILAIIIGAGFIAALGVGAWMILSDLKQSPTIVNVTTDIHAGKQSKRDYTRYTPGNIVYPRRGPDAFVEFLKQPGDIYISLGDNTNTCRDAGDYAPRLRAIADASDKSVYFGFGNHDCDPSFTEHLSGEKYYFVDFGRWRMIVLNSEEADYNPGGHNFGGFSEEQLAWLVRTLDTRRAVVLALSKPPFDKDLVTPKSSWHAFFEIVREHPNIRHVLGGDYHVFHETRAVDGVEYHFVQALTLEGSPGRFLRLELDNSWLRSLWRDWRAHRE